MRGVCLGTVVGYLLSKTPIASGCRNCVFSGRRQQSQVAPNPQASPTGLKEELLSALHCPYYWWWTTFVELLKVSTGTAISFLATLLSDDLPSGYVVITVVNWCFRHCSWQAPFSRPLLWEENMKTWCCCMCFFLSSVRFHSNRGGEFILLKKTAPWNREKEGHPSIKICQCQTFPGGESWGVWCSGKQFEIL